MRLHRILGTSPKGFDAQVPLDPFEEQFDLPAILVQQRDCERVKLKVVREEHIALIGFPVVVSDAPQFLWIRFPRLVSGKPDGLIAPQSLVLINLMRVETAEREIVFCPRDEERSRLMNGVQPFEVHV